MVDQVNMPISRNWERETFELFKAVGTIAQFIITRPIVAASANNSYNVTMFKHYVPYILTEVPFTKIKPLRFCIFTNPMV